MTLQNNNLTSKMQQCTSAIHYYIMSIVSDTVASLRMILWMGWLIFFLAPIQSDLDSQIKALLYIIVKSSVVGTMPTDETRPGKSEVCVSYTCISLF